MIAKMLVFIIVVPVLVLYHAWVGSSLWNWHVVPLGLPHIGTLNAVGIACLLSWLRSEPHPEQGETFDRRLVKRQFLGPLIFYIIGWAAATLT